MAQAVLNWTAAGGSNSTGQSVQYKKSTDSSWTTFSSLAPGVNTVTITGLLVNTIYDFKIVDNCTYGGPIDSSPDRKIAFNCPAVTVTPTFNSAIVSFPTMGADISKYVLQLLDSSGNSVIATQEITDVTPTTITKTFSSLSAVTTYNVRVTMYAGSTFSYTSICTPQSFTTGSTPVCLPPTTVSATMS